MKNLFQKLSLSAAVIAMALVVAAPLAIAPPASAHDGPTGPAVTITSPASSATVGRNFTISGTVNRGDGVLQLDVFIDGQLYVPAEVRNDTQGRGFSTARQDGAGPFSINLDLNGSKVTKDPAGSTFKGVSAGSHTVYVAASFGMDSGESPAVTLNVQDPKDAQAAQRTVREDPVAAVSPTPSPVASPSPTADLLGPGGEPVVAGAYDNLDPLLLFVLGILLGVGLLGLAEYSAKRYHARHRIRR